MFLVAHMDTENHVEPSGSHRSRLHIRRVPPPSSSVVLYQLFAKNKDSPPVAHNLPPLAGALTWSKGLLERVSLPMAKITGFNKKVCNHNAL